MEKQKKQRKPRKQEFVREQGHVYKAPKNLALRYALIEAWDKCHSRKGA